MHRFAKGLAVGGLAALAGLAALTPAGAAFEERFGLSWLFRSRGPIEPPADVVVVSLDRLSAERLRLPDAIQQWPRTTHAQAVDRLVEAGAAVIAFDLIFREPGEPDEDAALARAIADAGRVILFEYLDRNLRLILPQSTDSGIALLAREQLRSPLPAFAEAAAGLAPFPLPKVADRVSQYWAFRPENHGRATLPAVALQLYAAPAQPAWLRLLEEAGVEAVEGTGTAEAPVPKGELQGLISRTRAAFEADPGLGGRLREGLAGAELAGSELRMIEALIALYEGPDSRYLNLYGPPGQVRTIPLHELLAEPRPPDLSGRVVFVGQSDLINPHTDGFATAFSRADGIDLSGVEIAATALANFLDGRLLTPAGPGLALAVLCTFGLIAGLIARVLPAALAVAGVLALAALYFAGAQAAFTYQSLWLPVAIPLLVQLPLALFAGLLSQYHAARRARRNLSRGMRYYLPDAVVTQMDEGPLDPGAANEPVFSTCMVTDAVRFTAFAESVSPQEVRGFLNRYFEVLFGAVRRHGGIITDVVGDGMTCVWTAEGPDPSRRSAACQAAIEIQRAIRASMPGSLPLLPTRVGLHSGWVLVGNVGGSGRLVYSVVGDIVNTASRIETLNKQLGTRLLATSAVAEGLHDLLTRPLGRFRVVGKTEPLAIVELLDGAATTVERAHLTPFAEALDAFQAGKWQEASAAFEAALARRPDDGPACFYLRLLEEYAARGAPADEPTVVTLLSK